MEAVAFLVETIFKLYLMVVMLRLWLQLAQADFYNPLSQFIVKVTHPIIGPLRRVIPSIGRFDTATFVFALVIALANIWVIAAINGFMLTNVFWILKNALVMLLVEGVQLIIYVLIIRAILSWVSQGNNPLEFLFQQLTEPMIAPIRRIIPPIGGLDLSPMILIIFLLFIMRLF
ncbi:MULTISPECIES: YggT family protein [Alteromonadaceae]|uniref:YggT family protein n=1 Tax=Alteromonadaceae TaxID=72275 RepID=UPI001C09FC8D|nr:MULTISPECIES: YggT family protein [Aliiglaciecola]MBU2876591.1 YggT family protein [Aliiglaciecola lipolytica]MDO6711474.1 YggT family protein [Aliiglaciecola sp. 2_MG-2023]MDO6752549.1 YggT family protein [Aliiglaciecola sp. 1_MG-2023]